MTHSYRPDDDGADRQDPGQDEMPAFLSSRLMAVVSVVVVVALILGSAVAVFALTDWGLNAAGMIGLVVAALLVVLWLRLPGAGSGR